MRFLFILFIAISLYAKNVLIINSYSIKLPWTAGELKGILNVLNERKDLKIYIEFMDTKVFRPTPTRLFNFYEYLKNKYNGINIDVVITTDDNALNFVRKYKDTPLFKNAKVFFAGVNNLSLAKKLPKNVYAGVFEKKEPLANLELLKKIDPNLKRVYLVADNSTSAKSIIKEYKNALKNVKGIEFIYLNSKNLEDILSKLPYAPKHSAMMLLTPYSFYLKGNHINYKEAIKLISRYFPHPIVVHTDILTNIKNSNIIGGRVTDALTQGEEVAKKVVAYLNGNFMENLGFTFEKANRIYLNVRNLKKFGVDAYELGYKDAIYVNRPDNFIELYKEWIIGGVVIFFALIVLIVILYFKNIQLTRYNKRIEVSNKELENNLKRSINEIKDKEQKYYKTREEALKTVLKNILLYTMYSIDTGRIDELKKIIDEYIKSGEYISVKEAMENILKIIKFYEIYGVKVELKGEDGLIKVDKEKFYEFFIALLDILKENANNIEIRVKHNIIEISSNSDEEIDLEFLKILARGLAQIEKNGSKIVIKFL